MSSKKTIVLMLTMFVLILVGCDSTNPPIQTDTEPAEEQILPEKTSMPEPSPTPEKKAYSRSRNALTGANLTARGEPFLWGMGGALVLGILMIMGFLLLIFWNGITTFYPKPIQVVTLKDSSLVAGEPTRHDLYKPTPENYRQNVLCSLFRHIPNSQFNF